MKYFYTDDACEFPTGPHFSRFYVTSVLGTTSTILSLVGVVLYNRFARDWTYRRLLASTGAILIAVGLADIAFVLRWNLELGIPDHAMVLSTSAAEHVVSIFRAAPMQMFFAQLCPNGLEMQLMAILVGMNTAGGSVARLLGADVLGVRPNGEEGEEAKFNGLPVAMVINIGLRCLTLAFSPFLIPHAQQTQHLLGTDPASATVGSWLGRWRHEDCQVKETCRSEESSYQELSVL